MMELEMKSCSLEKLYAELEKQENAKSDIVVPPNSIMMEGGKMFLKNFGPLDDLLGSIEGVESSPLTIEPNELFLFQISQKLGITRAYAKRMLELQPNLFDYNVNEWLKFEAGAKKKSRNFLLRTFKDENGGASLGRAFLSDSFKIIDNFEVLKIALDAIMAEGKKTGVKIAVDTCSLTEKKMYCRFVLEEYNTNSKILGNYKNPIIGEQDPNGLISGFVLSNSEVGHGKLFTAPRIIVGSCNNGYIWYDEAYHKTHLGAKLDTGLVKSSKMTHSRNRDLILSQVRDVVRTFLSKDFLGQKVAELEAKGSYILDKPFETIVSVCSNLGIADDKDKVLNYFTKQNQCETSFDIMQAVTFFAQHDCNADKRFNLERQAVSMLDKIPSLDK